jgi:hypothetical protein
MKASHLIRAALLGVLILVVVVPHRAMPTQWIASLLGLQLTASIPKTIDGANGDWLTAKPYIGNTAILVSNGTETEWVWRDKLNDARGVFSPGEDTANWDIEQVRIIADSTYLYFYVEVDWFAAGMQDRFQFNIAMDTQITTNPSGGTTGFNWFGDDAGTSLGQAAQYSEVNVAIDNDGIYKYYDQAYGQPWKQLLWADGNKQWIHQDGWMEACIKWSDLGFTSVPSRLRLTMASAKRPNPGGSPNDIDKTQDAWNSDFLDVVSFGRYNCTDEWEDELSDATVSTYVDIAFDANGNCVNPALPAAPTNIRVFDATDSIWVTSGDTIRTNNPIISWDPVLPDGDAGDSIVGYYIQICTSSIVNADGFFHRDFATIVALNTTGTGPVNRVVYRNTDTPSNPQPWWGSANVLKDSIGVFNGTGDDYGDLPIFALGQTYYIRIWARDRRGMLGAASATYELPIDLPAWHDPYVFTPPSLTHSTTFRGNRDPKEGAFVNFVLGVFDPVPQDPKDNQYANPGPGGGTTPNEILNVILHIRKPGGAWNQVVLGNHWKDNGGTGDIQWYLPNIANKILGGNDPADSYSYWITDTSPWDGDPDVAKTWVYDYKAVNLGTGGTANTLYLAASAGDTIEYFFELNNPYEAPGGSGPMCRASRRFLYAYDANGITGYRTGSFAEATNRPLRFMVQKRDLSAVWHNPLSNEVLVGDTTYMMRDPAWPAGAQTVRMSVGGVGWGGWTFQMVWRDVDAGGWNVENFSGSSFLSDTDRMLYYYRHDFNYNGGMIEYYFKTSDDAVYIFANGITDNKDTVYNSSIGNDGQETVPFRFPYTSRVRVISTASVGNDSHTITAVIHFRSPRVEALDENALGVNNILNLNAAVAICTGNAFTNAFPSVYYQRSDTHGVSEPRRLFGRSREAFLAGFINVVNGLRKAFWGPIFPFDYIVTDSTTWNTGSDAYENVPILTYDEVFAPAWEKDKPGGTTFSVAEPIENVIHVLGDATINSMSITKGSLIADGSITIPATAVVTAERLDLCALNGQIKISGSLTIDTGIIFSNDTVVIDTGATLNLRQLGSVVAQYFTAESGAKLSVRHPTTMGFIAAKESVLSRTTRWIISSMRESR